MFEHLSIEFREDKSYVCNMTMAYRKKNWQSQKAKIRLQAWYMGKIVTDVSSLLKFQ